MSQHCSVSKRLLSGALPDENHLDGCVLSSRTLNKKPSLLGTKSLSLHLALLWRVSGKADAPVPRRFARPACWWGQPLGCVCRREHPGLRPRAAWPPGLRASTAPSQEALPALEATRSPRACRSTGG